MGYKIDGVEVSYQEWLDRMKSAAGPGEEERKRQLALQAEQAGNFANTSESGVNRLGQESQAQRDYMGKVARGEISLSGEQLRQGLQQNVAAQRSMAAGAAPQNAAMAARTAAMQSARMGSGMSGQAALAGMQERDAAQKALAQMILQQRGQDMQGALGSRQNAMQGYAPPPPKAPEKTALDYGLQAAVAAAPFFASDKRLKTDIKDGDDDARRTMEALKSYAYNYKDKKHGEGKQLGVLAQDLEKTGLGKQTVIDTPEGKMVHGAKLAGANTAMIVALGRRVAAMEKGSK